jgi:hypothetical protein
VDLADAVDAEVLAVHPLDLDLQLLVGDRPWRGWPLLAGVVGARCDLDVGAGEGGADRLDSELVLVLIDVVDDQRLGRSSSAAKKADAERRSRSLGAVP